MVKHKKQTQVGQHLQKVKEAITEEDLNSALKWLFKQSLVIDPIGFLNGNPLETAPLYEDASEELRAALGEFIQLYKIRKDLGLVAVLGDDNTTGSLSRAGFNAKGVPYRARSHTISGVYSEERYKSLKLDFEQRQTYVDSVVRAALEMTPRLVLSPLFPRVNYRSEHDKNDSLFDAEGIIIYRMIQAENGRTGRNVGFLGLPGSLALGSEYGSFKLAKVPVVECSPANYHRDVRLGVSNALGNMR